MLWGLRYSVSVGLLAVALSACIPSGAQQNACIFSLDALHSPWTDHGDSDISFCIQDTGEYLQFHWVVTDTHLVLHEHIDEEYGALHSDRVELFLSEDEELDSYYAFEIDLSGRVLDYRASYYRQTDFDWDWPSDHYDVELDVQGDQYSVTLSMSKSILSEYGLLIDRELIAGIFRADYTQHAKDAVEWLTWIDPDTAQPDFHVPQVFGYITLPK